MKVYRIVHVTASGAIFYLKTYFLLLFSLANKKCTEEEEKRCLPLVCNCGLSLKVFKKDFNLGTHSGMSTVMAFSLLANFEARLSKKISSLTIISSV